MSLIWQAAYYDGQTASRHQVSVQVTTSGLRVSMEDGKVHWWPYGEIRQAPRHHAGEPLRLERGTGLAETLVVSDPSFIPALHYAAPSLRRRFQPPSGWRGALGMVLVAGAALLLLTSVIYAWVIPTFADQVASWIPLPWEEKLGEMVVEEVAPPRVRCTDPTIGSAVDMIVARLKAAAPGVPYTFRVTVVDQPLVNALAAPGGYVVVYRGLLEKTDRPEELAGVLAHEMQHVIHRHGTRALVRHMSLRLFIALATGGGLTGQVAGQVAGLRYTREAELQADRDGMKLIQAASLDPEGMIRIYLRLREEEQRLPGFVRYLSTHPGIDDRITLLRTLAASPAHDPTPLATTIPWKTLVSSCRPNPR